MIESHSTRSEAGGKFKEKRGWLLVGLAVALIALELTLNFFPMLPQAWKPYTHALNYMAIGFGSIGARTIAVARKRNVKSLRLEKI